MLKEEVLKIINKYNLIEPKDKILIGVSGGPDSMCLLSILDSLKHDLNFEILVAHVNHKMRLEADEEAEFVRDFCKKIGAKCYVKEENIKQLALEKKMGTEETGRMVRYNFFDEICEENAANKVATAHNSNDRAETVLLNIVRGSGISRLKRNRTNKR